MNTNDNSALIKTRVSQKITVPNVGSEGVWWEGWMRPFPPIGTRITFSSQPGPWSEFDVESCYYNARDDSQEIYAVEKIFRRTDPDNGLPPGEGNMLSELTMHMRAGWQVTSIPWQKRCQKEIEFRRKIRG